MSVSTNSAHQILDVKPDANAEEIRKAYLSLVRKHPPDREPDKFREIHSAYQMLNDPMVQAETLLKPNRDKPDLFAIIAAAEKVRPRLSTLNLLALGNQE